VPVMAADEINETSNPWYWYNKAVDLANEGKYSEALQANEQALAFNESSPLRRLIKPESSFNLENMMRQS